MNATLEKKKKKWKFSKLDCETFEMRVDPLFESHVHETLSHHFCQTKLMYMFDSYLHLYDFNGLFTFNAIDCYFY